MKFEFSEEKDFAIYQCKIVTCNGVLFFSAQLPITIVGYNIRGAFINPVKIAALPRHIVEDDNVRRLFMGANGLSVLVVVVNKDPSESMIMLELFEDEKDELVWEWREFATRPPMSLPLYFDIVYGDFVVVGDYLCFIRRNGVVAEGVAYNLKDGLWQSLPQCSDVKYFRILSFQPQLKVKGWQSSLCTGFY
ncbi:hypothetical protein SUGI_0989850 [Cryptomeria japonica]|nr:hypothetical protein SUGI_0989850 [Cryptomeria japonica]